MGIRGGRVVRERFPHRRVAMYPGKIWSGAGALFAVVISFGMGPAWLMQLGGDGPRPAVDDGVHPVVELGIGLGVGLAVLLLPLAAGMYIRDIWTGRPLLVVDQRGITSNSTWTGPRFLHWSEINAVRPVSGQPGLSYIAVSVRDDARVHMGPVTRLNRRLGGAVMHIQTARLPLSMDDALHEIEAIAPRDVSVVTGRRRTR